MAHVSVNEQSDGVAVLTIDRPPANAMDVALLRELNAAVAHLASAPPRALVLAGRPGFFSAGADLKAVPGYGAEEQREMVDAINEMALGVYELPCPVVGAITGHAIAGGLVLALCTDQRVVSTEGRYGLTEVKVGVPYPQAAIGVVAAELPPHAARALALGSALIDSAEAMRLGVFDEAIAPEQVLARALALAAAMAELPADVYARTKHDLRAATAARLREAAASDPLLARWVA
ncbi:MAG TPA: enoyl-CoA hydratase/isomerase family protein [Solirubrobacteraceae bacterium]|jgi:enoyl-CoA hydratase